MWVLHPKQNELTNKNYAPTPEEVEHSKEMLRIYEIAQKDDRGVAIIEGTFIGPPIVVAAKKIIERNRIIEERMKNIAANK
jgi:citrate lyase subunit beta/citryl-CoA lyase